MTTEAERARWVDYDEEAAWRNSDPATQLVPPLFIDGMSHIRGDWHCCVSAEECEVCGVGIIHSQGVYGGLVKLCDYCGTSF